MVAITLITSNKQHNSRSLNGNGQNGHLKGPLKLTKEAVAVPVKMPGTGGINLIYIFTTTTNENVHAIATLFLYITVYI